MRPVRRWDTPIRRGGEEPPPPLVPPIDGKPTFEQAVEQWLEEHVSTKTGRPYSATTRTVARYNLLGGRLTAWREARGIRLAEEWTAPSAAEYLAWYQHDIGADADTVKKVQTQLRQFAGFCAQRFANQEAIGPALDDLRISSSHDRAPATQTALTPAEATTLLQKASTPRDCLIVAMLLYTGIRPGELVALDEKSYEARIHSARRRDSWDRLRQIRDENAGRISRHTAHHRPDRHPAPRSRTPERPHSSWCELRVLLSTRRDRRGAATRLTIAGVNLVLHTLGRTTGIHCNPRRLRHTFCTWCADAGMDLIVLQHLLGNEDSEMVVRYYRRRGSEDAIFAAAQIRF